MLTTTEIGMSATKGKPSLQLSYNLDQIVRAIQLNGGSMSRTKLRNQLQLSDDELNAALYHGCEEKFLQKGEYNFFAVKKPFTINEERFYPSVEIGLKRLWAAENFHENEFYLEETASRDSKIAGRWTRPDFTMISHKKFAWTIGHEFDVVTFEVKRPGNPPGK